ncbi:hypothetical protein A2U01_0101303, partial [Trifolium medium]|nr:hypothetical protein [Trifolium medium]
LFFFDATAAVEASSAPLSSETG